MADRVDSILRDYFSGRLELKIKQREETIDYYKVGHKDGYTAEQIEMLTLGTNRADNIRKQRLIKVPEKSKDDYYLGFLDGQNEYQDDYSMNAAFGFDL
ncbi:hypothetical protein [Leuconostoc mesenteroides]|uniref:hypothetical protein n=1 Tax=Leuconostoc mesenteroides TaxID=1245 RepID=UPI00236201DF|nr:hypothetical protein [Leuconostoc mesenteroides]